MKFTYNWLKDFVDIKITPRALADKLTMAGLEVTSLEEKAGDFIFEIEVTSNRPDCLSVIGIAREVAAILGHRLKDIGDRLNKKCLPPTTYHLPPFSIKIEDKKDCPFYSAKIIRDVRCGPSVDWLKVRLESVGCRSVNNIVDITNYILFTYGEPLHAFDLDKLVSGLAGQPVSQSEIIVRRAQKEEEIIGIDGIKRILGEDILVIASGSIHTGTPAHRHTGTPIAIAGIMGGKDTEVTADTKNILLEAAIFNPVVVRRGRQKLGVQSESSYRFERGINADIVEIAAWQAAELIRELAGGRCLLTKASGSARARKNDIVLELESVRKILGIDIARRDIKAILDCLGFESKPKAKYMLYVKSPSHRQDVSAGIDLIEEIARIYGFDSIPTSLPAVKPRVSVDERRDLVAFIKNILTGLGLSEVVTYSLMDKEKLQGFTAASEASAIGILNPLSIEQGILRPTLLPGLLSCLALNLNQQQDYIYIFEIASVFTQEAGNIKEELALSIAACGSKPLLLEQGLIKEEMGLLHLKGALETLFQRLGVREYKLHYTDNRESIEVCVGKEAIGFLRQFSNRALDKFEIKNKKVFGLEVFLYKLLPYVNRKIRFTALPIYPAISRDLSLILNDSVRADDVLGVIKKEAGHLLCELKIIDSYKGKQIPPGFKGLTISCLYRSAERTLTEAEIDSIQAVVYEVLTREFGAKLRA